MLLAFPSEKEPIQNQKILFLDIDGVLNSEVYFKSASHSDSSTSRFDPICVELIKKLVEEFSLQIVISSTWRYGATDRLMHELKNSKLIGYLYHDWFTPVIHPAHRGTEIKLWLDLHPEVIDYIIIDVDEPKFYQRSRQDPCLVSDIFISNFIALHNNRPSGPLEIYNFVPFSKRRKQFCGIQRDWVGVLSLHAPPVILARACSSLIASCRMTWAYFPLSEGIPDSLFPPYR